MNWWRLLCNIVRAAVRGDEADRRAKMRRAREAASAEAEARRAREAAERLKQ